jgi:hypothetical protein
MDTHFSAQSGRVKGRVTRQPGFLACMSGLLALFTLPVAAQTNPLVVSTVAGLANFGSADGIGSAAKFLLPTSVAVDGAGNVYVADTDNDTIRKVTPAGVVTTLAGTAQMPGTNDATGGAARFNQPHGVAVDNSGNIYVADTYNFTIRKITSNGVVTTIAGQPGDYGSDNGPATGGAQFLYPFGVAVDSSTNIYVADTGNNMIREITNATSMVGTLAGNLTAGTNNGSGASAQFDSPYALATDGAGNVYVADTDNSLIRFITPLGAVTNIASGAAFSYPTGIAVDSATNVYVADYDNQIVRKLTFNGTAWNVSTNAGSGFSGDGDGISPQATFNYPWGVAVDSASNVYVGDSGNGNIREITFTNSAWNLSTLAGPDESYGVYTVGPEGQPRFHQPSGVAVDSATNLYVADFYNNCIRLVTPAGTVTTLAGSVNGFYGTNDGPSTSAEFHYPSGLCVDAATNIYVADYYNSTVRKITPTNNGAWVTATLAGQAGVTNYVNATNGANATFDGPYAVAVDGATNLYVTDVGNKVVRKLTLNGTNWAVTNYPSAGGPAFISPRGIAVDSSTNVYVADLGGNLVYMIAPSGAVTSHGGALFNSPQGVAVDSAGNVYVANTGANTILGITSGGQFTNTIAGTAGLAGSADGLGSAAQFDFPIGLAVDASSNVYVADALNNTIRKGTPYTAQTVVLTLATSPDGLPLEVNGINYAYTPQVIALEAGSLNTNTATATNDYAFINWTQGGTVVSTSNLYAFTLNSNETLVANFLPGYTLTVSASPTNGGTVSGGGTFAAGSTDTVTATANGGYIFSNWTQGGTVESTSSNYTFTLGSNETLVANFVTTPLPSLSITQSNGVTFLSWPGSTNNFTLETTTNLSPAVWVIVTNLPALSGGIFTVSNLWTDQMRFFRLATIQQPLLSITQSNGVTFLFWTSSAAGFALESTTNLNSANWAVVTNAPALSGGYFIVSNAWPDQTRFFQLIFQ